MGGSDTREYTGLWDQGQQTAPSPCAGGDESSLSCQRHHRYGDDCDDHFGQHDQGSSDLDGQELDLDDDGAECGTYLSMWKKNLGSYDGYSSSRTCLGSDSKDRAANIDRAIISHEDTPIRPGVGPGSYARTFEELLEQSLKAQEIASSDGGSIRSEDSLAADMSLLDRSMAFVEEDPPEAGKLLQLRNISERDIAQGKRLVAMDEVQETLEKLHKEVLTLSRAVATDDRSSSCSASSGEESQRLLMASSPVYGGLQRARRTGEEIPNDCSIGCRREADALEEEIHSGATADLRGNSAQRSNCRGKHRHMVNASGQNFQKLSRLPTGRKNLAVSWEDGHAGGVQPSLRCAKEAKRPRPLQVAHEQSGKAHKPSVEGISQMVPDHLLPRASSIGGGDSACTRLHVRGGDLRRYHLPFEENADSTAVVRQMEVDWCPMLSATVVAGVKDKDDGDVDAEMDQSTDEDGGGKVHRCEKTSDIVFDGAASLPNTRGTVTQACENGTAHSIGSGSPICVSNSNFGLHKTSQKDVDSCHVAQPRSMTDLNSKLSISLSKSNVPNQLDIACLTGVVSNVKESQDDMMSDPVSSCDDESLSAADKESIDNESAPLLSLFDLQSPCVEGRCNVDGPKEEVGNKECNKGDVKFEDILALLNLRIKKGDSEDIPLPDAKEIAAVGHSDVTGSQKLNSGCVSKSCLQMEPCGTVSTRPTVGGYDATEYENGFVCEDVRIRRAESPSAEQLLCSRVAADDDKVRECAGGSPRPPDSDLHSSCLEFDSYPVYPMAVVDHGESGQYAFPNPGLFENYQHLWLHYPDQCAADTDLKFYMRATEREITRKVPHDSSVSCAASTGPLDHGSVSQRDQAEQVVSSAELEEEQALNLGGGLPLRACLVPLRDLVNRPRERSQVGMDKHTAVLLYRNPLWTDSSQDLSYLLGNGHIPGESDAQLNADGKNVVNYAPRPHRSDRRKGWNVDGSISMNALRMASLLPPDEESPEFQDCSSEKHNGRQLRKNCPLNDKSGSGGTCKERTCEDSYHDSEEFWLSQSSLLEGYASESLTATDRGLVKGMADVSSGSSISGSLSCNNPDGTVSSSGRVDALNGLPAVTKQEEYRAHQLSDICDASDPVDELISVVDQDNRGEKAVASEKKRSSEGWFLSLDTPVGRDDGSARGRVESVRPLWREGVGKSKNVVQIAYGCKIPSQQTGLPHGERIIEGKSAESAAEAEAEVETLRDTNSGAMTIHQVSRKYQVDNMAGRQFTRSGMKHNGVRDVRGCDGSSTFSPKSVMQAGHILEVENDFGECVTKDNHSTKGYNSSKEDEMASKGPVPDPEKAHGHCTTCGTTCGTKCGGCDIIGGSHMKNSSVESGVIYQEDHGRLLRPPPSSNIKQGETQTSLAAGEHVGETEKLLAALELEEFRFLERRVRKEVEGTKAKESSMCDLNSLRHATKSEVVDRHCSQASTLERTGKIFPEANTTSEHFEEPSPGEWTAGFDDRSTWSEEGEQAKSCSQGVDECCATSAAVPQEGQDTMPYAPEQTTTQLTGDPMSKLVRSYFLPGKNLKDSSNRTPPDGINVENSDGFALVQKKVQVLEAEILKFQAETKKAQRLAKEYEEKAYQLAQEKVSWEQQKRKDVQAFSEFKEEQMRKVKKHHQMLEKLSQDLLQLPTKKERNQIDELKAEMTQMKEENLKKESRWRLTNKRLRGIIDELTGQSRELQEEIKRYEERLHKEWQAKDATSASKSEKGTSVDYNIMSISMRESSQYVTMEDYTSYHQIMDSSTSLQMSSELLETRHRRQPYHLETRTGSGGGAGSGAMMAKVKPPQSKDRGEMDMAKEARVSGEENGTSFRKSKFLRASDRTGLASRDLEMSGMEMEGGRSSQIKDPIKNVAGQSESTLRSASLQQGRSPSPNDTNQGLYNGRYMETLASRVTTSEVPPAANGHPPLEQKFQGGGVLQSLQHADVWRPDNGSDDGRSSPSIPNAANPEENVSVDDCVYFANGDIKNTLPDGSIEYYYSEVDTWHTTKPNGVEIFYFPDYQVEEHWPNGQKKIISPDGTFYVIGAE